MARATGQATRGRKKDALRLYAEAHASEAGTGTDLDREVEYVPGSKKDATVTITIPRGALFVPRALTVGKSPNTVRQTLRTVLNTLGITGEVHAYGVEREDSDVPEAEVKETVWYITGAAKPKPRTRSKK